MLVAPFAEGIGPPEKSLVARLLDDAKATTSYDPIGGLFVEMNTRPPPAAGSRACRVSTAASSPNPPASNPLKAIFKADDR